MTCAQEAGGVCKARQAKSEHGALPGFQERRGRAPVEANMAIAALNGLPSVGCPQWAALNGPPTMGCPQWAAPNGPPTMSELPSMGSLKML